MSECIAKSKDANLSVIMKEKYGSEVPYDNLTVIMTHENYFYLIDREGTRAVLPSSNWAILELKNKD